MGGELTRTQNFLTPRVIIMMTKRLRSPKEDDSLEYPPEFVVASVKIGYA